MPSSLSLSPAVQPCRATARRQQMVAAAPLEHRKPHRAPRAVQCPQHCPVKTPVPCRWYGMVDICDGYLAALQPACRFLLTTIQRSWRFKTWYGKCVSVSVPLLILLPASRSADMHAGMNIGSTGFKYIILEVKMKTKEALR